MALYIYFKYIGTGNIYITDKHKPDGQNIA